jgi:hypothetical protein
MAITYHIHVRGHLGAQWSQWFDGLQITTMANRESLLSGALPDQAALFGVLARIRDLGLTLLSVERVANGETVAQPLALHELPASAHVVRDGPDV